MGPEDSASLLVWARNAVGSNSVIAFSQRRDDAARYTYLGVRWQTSRDRVLGLDDGLHEILLLDRARRIEPVSLGISLQPFQRKRTQERRMPRCH